MSQSQLELRHLRTLVAIASVGNLSAAAKRLHLTQSALSHQLKMLETAYGVSLIDRRRQPVVLTHAGECLLALARTVLRMDSEITR